MNRWLELLRDDDYIGVKKYIASGGDLSETNETGESVLACALRENCDIDLLMLLIESGADIFAIDNEGVSVFDMAVTYGNVDIVNYLIDNGQDVNATSRKSGFTALMAAASYGRVEVVKVLLKNGADVKQKDLKGFTAIDFARKMNKKTVLDVLGYDENSAKNTGYAR